MGKGNLNDSTGSLRGAGPPSAHGGARYPPVTCTGTCPAGGGHSEHSRSHLVPGLVSNTIFQYREKWPTLGLGQWTYKMSLEHLVVPEREAELQPNKSHSVGVGGVKGLRSHLRAPPMAKAGTINATKWSSTDAPWFTTGLHPNKTTVSQNYHKWKMH